MEQTLLRNFLFTVILDPIPGAFIEGEHKLRSQALMFRGRGGGLAARVVTGLTRVLLPSQMLSSCSPRCSNWTCADMCSWGILSLANDPISLSGVGVGRVKGGLLMRQLTWQNNHINVPGRHSSKWAFPLTCSIIWLLLTNLILQMEMRVFTRKNQHTYDGNLSKVKAVVMEEYSDVTLAMN